MSFVRLACLACIAILLPHLASAETARIRREGAQLRGETGFSGAVLAAPAPGDAVEVLQSSNEWRRVRTADGREGWLHELFLDEPRTPGRASTPTAPVRDHSAPPVRDRTAPGSLPTARPFEAVPVEEAADPTLGGESSRLRAALEEERGARGAAEAALGESETALRSAEAALRSAVDRETELERRVAGLEDERRRLEAASSEDAQLIRELRTRLADETARLRRDAEDERSRDLTALERDHAATLLTLETGHAEELAELRAAHEVELAGLSEKHAAELAVARSAKSAEIAALQQRLQDEQDRIGKTFVENCSALHERELNRKAAQWSVDCDARLAEQQAAHAKELRKVSKESGWEEEFEREVRARVKTELDDRLDEAHLRWEARNRGDKIELDRELAKLRTQLEAECEGRVLAAVNAKLEGHRREMNDALKALRAEEELRCRTALELVLERSAAEAGQAVTSPGESRP